MVLDVLKDLQPEIDSLFDKVRSESPMAQRLSKTEWNKVRQEVSVPLIQGFKTGRVKTQEEHDKMFKMAEELAHIQIILISHSKWR